MTTLAMRLGILLAGVTAAVHIFVGTYDTLLPLLAADLALVVKGTFHACWHFVSIFLAMSVWHFAKATPSAKMLAWLWVCFGLVFVAVGAFAEGVGGLIALPQWILLLPAGGLVLWGLKQTGRRDA